MPKATVCLPWRPQPDRLAAHDRCLKFWLDNGFATIEADSDPRKPFLCNQARNNAVRGADTPAVIVADADTLPHDITQVHAAIEIAAQRRAVVWPFTIYRIIPADAVDSDDLYNVEVVDEVTNATGGVVVAHRDTYWDLGGYDEGFVPGAWGYDDAAFMQAAQTLGTAMRIAGIVYSFNHGVRREVLDTANYPRSLLYRFALGNPDVMRSLLGLR